VCSRGRNEFAEEHFDARADVVSNPTDSVEVELGRV
jgi:hypothetical protein